MRNPAFVQVVGPLAPFAAGFCVRLELVGYAPESRAVYLRLMAQLSRWLDERGLDGSALSTAVMDEFLRGRRARRQSARSIRSRRSPLLEYLREIGVSPLPVQQVDGPAEMLLVDYGAYLAHERGLAATTVQQHREQLSRPVDQDL